jgi:hypothetical protein
MAIQKWTDPTTTPALSMTTELNALANDAGALSTAAYDNRTALAQYANFELVGTFSTAPTADKTIDLYAIYQQDGTNYEDYSATRPPLTLLGSFVLDNTGSAQRHGIFGVMLLPLPFKLYAVNKSGYAFTSSGHTIKMWTFNNQVV